MKNLKKFILFTALLVSTFSQLYTNVPVAHAATPGAGTQSSAVTLAALQAISVATTPAQLQSALQSFLDQYTVTSDPYCDVTSGSPLRNSLTTCNDLGTQNFTSSKAFANAFVQEWSKYPVAFINSIGLQKIYLIDKTYQTTYQVGAAYNPTNKFMYYDTTFGDSTYSRAELIHHEFFHYVDSVRFGDIANTSDVNWTSLNPSGFTYTSTGQSCYQAACPTGEHPLAGFATGYATTLEPEDRAETAAYLMETDNYTKLTGWQATDAVLASKVTYIKNIYKAFDVTMNDAYFTAIHAYAQANYNLQFYSQITADNHITTDQLGGNYIVNSQATLTVDAKINRATVLSGGILKGSGTVTSGINVDPGGIIAPGHSPGCITTTDLVVGGTYQAELGGATACNGYDQIKATSSVTLFSDGGIGGNIDGILQLVLYGGFVPNVGDKFTIIDNQSSAAVSGNFKGLDESAQFTQDGVTYSVTYKGGDGNDVVLTVMSVNAAALPKAPNTGFELLTANPLASLLVTVLAGSSLLFMSRRIAVANN